MSRGQQKRLKALEAENQRLRRAVSDLMLDKMILVEAAHGVKGVPETDRGGGSALKGWTS